LAELVQEKTGGILSRDPILYGAYRDDGVAFDPVASAWQWNIGSHPRQELTDNVVDLMAEKLKRLSPPPRKR